MSRSNRVVVANTHEMFAPQFMSVFKLLIGYSVWESRTDVVSLFIKIQLVDIYRFENIFKIQQWLSITIDDFLLAYSIVCDKIKFRSSIRPAKRYR
jgi:hypothetical protein